MASLEFTYNTGAAWTDLLGTRWHAYGRRPLERLADAGGLAQWLREVGLEPQNVPDESDVALAQEVRESIRTVMASTLGRKQAEDAPAADVAARTLQQLQTAEWAPVMVDAAGDLRIRRPANTRAAMARLLNDAVTDLAHHPGDLHSCADDDCAKVYLDASNVRRYCGPTCATRARVRTHRARSRQGNLAAKEDSADASAFARGIAATRVQAARPVTSGGH